MQDSSALVDSLHPLERKVLSALGAHGSQGTPAVGETKLAQSTSLDPSQISMAVGWLLSKGLVRIQEETIATLVSLTDIGEQYGKTQAPIERILSAITRAQKTGKRLTIAGIQAAEHMEAPDMSGAIGILKKEGVIRIVPGANLN